MLLQIGAQFPNLAVLGLGKNLKFLIISKKIRTDEKFSDVDRLFEPLSEFIFRVGLEAEEEVVLVEALQTPGVVVADGDARGRAGVPARRRAVVRVHIQQRIRLTAADAAAAHQGGRLSSESRPVETRVRLVKDVLGAAGSARRPAFLRK